MGDATACWVPPADPRAFFQPSPRAVAVVPASRAALSASLEMQVAALREKVRAQQDRGVWKVRGTRFVSSPEVHRLQCELASARERVSAKSRRSSSFLGFTGVGKKESKTASSPKPEVEYPLHHAKSDPYMSGRIAALAGRNACGHRSSSWFARPSAAGEYTEAATDGDDDIAALDNVDSFLRATAANLASATSSGAPEVPPPSVLPLLRVLKNVCSALEEHRSDEEDTSQPPTEGGQPCACIEQQQQQQPVVPSPRLPAKETAARTQCVATIYHDGSVPEAIRAVASCQRKTSLMRRQLAEAARARRALLSCRVALIGVEAPMLSASASTQ
eukprot:m51a1_g3735 hypothetical protein (332) ;mRNA; r:36784-38054